MFGSHPCVYFMHSTFGKAFKQLVSNQTDKHLEGIQSEPCPVGACFIFIALFRF